MEARACYLASEWDANGPTPPRLAIREVGPRLESLILTLFQTHLSTFVSPAKENLTWKKEHPVVRGRSTDIGSPPGQVGRGLCLSAPQHPRVKLRGALGRMVAPLSR